MKLTLNKFYVKDIQFADESSYKEDVYKRQGLCGWNQRRTGEI